MRAGRPKSVPAELDIHCIVDNYATHSHPTIKAWLAARPEPHRVSRRPVGLSQTGMV
jgi:hypothetical protein